MSMQFDISPFGKKFSFTKSHSGTFSVLQSSILFNCYKNSSKFIISYQIKVQLEGTYSKETVITTDPQMQ